MHSLSTIARGWYLYIKAAPQTKQLIAERLAICDTCPHKRQVSKLGQVLVQAMNEEGSVFQCGLCGCPLAAMTADPANKCKDKRWGVAGTKQTYFP